MKATIINTALFAVLTVAASNCWAAHNVSRELQTLVNFGKSAKTERQADAQFARLRQIAPSDARVPYTYALILVERHRYTDAAEQIKAATDMNGSNLDAWKTRIWLSVITKDFDDALEIMENLTQRMPAKNSAADRERKCVQFAAFMGQVIGYLEGPAKVDSVKLAGYEQSIGGSLTGGRKSAFDKMRQDVNHKFVSATNQIGGLRNRAATGEASARERELAHVNNDRRYTWTEKEKIEGLRAQDRASKANERNVNAATRGYSAGGNYGIAVSRYNDEEQLGPFYRRIPTNGDTNNDEFELDHEYDRYRNFNSARQYGGSYEEERGLNDLHYADTNRREDQYDNYLADKDRDLNHRHRRLSKEESRLARRPVNGTSAQIRSLVAKSTALGSYVALPVSTAREINTVLASY